MGATVRRQDQNKKPPIKNVVVTCCHSELDTLLADRHSGGVRVEVTQRGSSIAGMGVVVVGHADWQALRDAIDEMFSQDVPE